MKSPKIRTAIARFLIAIVIFFNLECALAFLIKPELYRGSFELVGVPGEIMVMSLGILFIMWNVPYLFALLSPSRYRISLIEALLMQTIGLFGETILLVRLPAGHATLRDTALRFILFDSFGLAALAIAFLLTQRKSFSIFRARANKETQ